MSELGPNRSHKTSGNVHMPIALDHVFICCDEYAPEAESLLDIGLIEGSSNVHPGQGTANRRFFFHGGFIELLWVSSPQEAQSSLTAPTKLWPRWAARKQGACPFGIAFSPSAADVPEPPFSAWPYRPMYLPPTKSILFAQHTTLREPELFYMGWPHTQASAASQPMEHANGLLRLHAASVGIPAGTPLSASSLAVQSAGLLSFHTATQYELTLSFESALPVTFDLRPTLPLTMTGSHHEV
jgi:Glyoxalase-like domain